MNPRLEVALPDVPPAVALPAMPRGKKRAEPDEPETELAQKHRSVCKAVDDGGPLLCPITPGAARLTL